MRRTPLVVVAVDVQDPGNLGAIVRVAEAGGATGVIAAGRVGRPVRLEGAARVDGQRAAPADRHAARPPTTAIAEARRHGCRVIATVPRGGRSLFDVDLRGPIAVLIGGEGRGLPPALVDAADERVTIPMQAPVESLNAAVTAALIVYEARRQRQELERFARSRLS